ncbi:MAG: hypothetical protein ACK4UU_02495 [Fimbriimonadales bacterium]
MEASVYPMIRSEKVGSVLQLSAQFTAPVDGSVAQQRLHEFLRHLGYAYDSRTSKWTRGSLLGNLTSMQPRALKAAVEARFTPAGEATTVHLNLSVNLFGQIITDAEVEAFKAELREAARYVGDGQADFARLEQQQSAVKSLGMFAFALALAISIPILVGLFLVVRPLLVDLGVSRPMRILFSAGLGGAVVGTLVLIFAKRMLRAPRR